MHEFQTDEVRIQYPIYFKVANYFRSKRFALFIRLLEVEKNSRILDVGGTFAFWKDLDYDNVTLLNVQDELSNTKINAVKYNGGKFPFEDKEFEVIFSNSTIEHVGDFGDQKLFASEINRVSKKYFVQTPSFFFPYEPHAHIPFFQFFPSNIKIILRKIYPKSTYPIEELLSIRLLTKKELKYIFPFSNIIKEKNIIFNKIIFYSQK